MGIDGCVPEQFMENEQNMALALFFFCSKIHTHTPTIWWCRRRRPWVFFVSSFFGLGNGMSHHAFERGVEVTFVLSQAGGRGKVKGKRM